MNEHTHEKYFAKLSQYCPKNPNWAHDLAAEMEQQRRSPAYQEGVRDGWHGEADPAGLATDANYGDTVNPQ